MGRDEEKRPPEKTVTLESTMAFEDGTVRFSAELEGVVTRTEALAELTKSLDAEEWAMRLLLRGALKLGGAVQKNALNTEMVQRSGEEWI